MNQSQRIELLIEINHPLYRSKHQCNTRGLRKREAINQSQAVVKVREEELSGLLFECTPFLSQLDTFWHCFWQQLHIILIIIIIIVIRTNDSDTNLRLVLLQIDK